MTAKFSTLGPPGKGYWNPYFSGRGMLLAALFSGWVPAHLKVGFPWWAVFHSALQRLGFNTKKNLESSHEGVRNPRAVFTEPQSAYTTSPFTQWWWFYEPCVFFGHIITCPLCVTLASGRPFISMMVLGREAHSLLTLTLWAHWSNRPRPRPWYNSLIVWAILFIVPGGTILASSRLIRIWSGHRETFFASYYQCRINIVPSNQTTTEGPAPPFTEIKPPARMTISQYFTKSSFNYISIAPFFWII